MGNGWALLVFSSGRALVISFSSAQSLFSHKTHSNTVSSKPLYPSFWGLVIFSLFSLGLPPVVFILVGKQEAEGQLTVRQMCAFSLLKETHYVA